MTYQVVVPLVIAKDQDGRPYHVYQGGIIQWLSDEQRDHFLGTGLVVDLNGPAPAEDDDESGDEITLPAKTAKVSMLEDWLIANDPDGPTREDLEPLNKAELWERIDAVWASL